MEENRCGYQAGQEAARGADLNHPAMDHGASTLEAPMLNQLKRHEVQVPVMRRAPPPTGGGNTDDIEAAAYSEASFWCKFQKGRA